jgi:ABC-type multidrug transport system fused ATPase/permease subunit
MCSTWVTVSSPPRFLQAERDLRERRRREEEERVRKEKEARERLEARRRRAVTAMQSLFRGHRERKVMMVMMLVMMLVMMMMMMIMMMMLMLMVRLKAMTASRVMMMMMTTTRLLIRIIITTRFLTMLAIPSRPQVYKLERLASLLRSDKASRSDDAQALQDLMADIARTKTAKPELQVRGDYGSLHLIKCGKPGCP